MVTLLIPCELSVEMAQSMDTSTDRSSYCHKREKLSHRSSNSDKWFPPYHFQIELLGPVARSMVSANPG